MPQNCPYCRESISDSELVECPTCHAPHHRDCWIENGGCTVFGCENAPIDDPKIAVSIHDISTEEGAQSYYLFKNNQQYGPYTLDALRQESYQGTISRDDLIWTEGMGNWVRLSQILDTTLVSQKTSIQAASLGSINTEIDDPCAGRIRFGRGVYFLSYLAGIFVMLALRTSPQTEGVGALILSCTWITASILRARDVGISGWFGLLLLIPIANLIFFVFLLLVPRGFAITKKADTVLRVMLWGILALLALFIIGIVISASINK
jgi:hypothetical protein